MDLIILFIQTLLAFFFGFTLYTVPMSPDTVTVSPPTIITATAPDAGGDAGTIRAYTIIESVSASVLESAPAQLQLQVEGYQPDGCDYPVVTEIAQSGTFIVVEIYREVPMAVMCPMNIVGYSETISVPGAFAPGTYTISVNDQIITVEI